MPAVSVSETRGAQLTLILTRRCQKTCPDCPVAPGSADMTAPVLKKAISLFAASGRTDGSVKFFGGEPLLRFDLIEAGVSRLSRNGFGGAVEVGTNGLLLDTAKLEYFSARPRVQINLNSLVSVNRKFSALPNLVWNLLVPPDDPLSALRVLSRVRKASGRTPPRINVLPAYYREWSAESLAMLEKILERAKGLAGAGEIRLENAARWGPIPLFNSGITVDTDGRYYHSNLVLAARPVSAAKALLAGDLNTPRFKVPAPGRPDLLAIAKRIFGVKALAGGLAADRLAERVFSG